MAKESILDVEGSALDIAVGLAQGRQLAFVDSVPYAYTSLGNLVQWRPSSNWNQGGEIISKRGISVNQLIGGDWYASIFATGMTTLIWTTGRTPLIAAMRAYVLSKEK